LLRDGQGNAMAGGPLTLVIERPDGVEFRRAQLPDQGAGGRSLVLPLNSAVPTGTWRVRAFTDPKGSSVGETTFMVEDYIPERIEFDVSAKEKMIKAELPVELKVAGKFLYGAPASGLQLEGDMLVAPAASGRPGYPGYQFGVADEETASNERTPIENLPEADANGVATFPVSLAPQPGRYRLDVKSTEADGPVTSVQFDVGWYSDGSADTPDLLETSIDKPEYASGDTMVVSVNARTAGKLTINVLGDRLLTT